MKKIVNEFKNSVNETYEREGLIAARAWAIVLPIFAVSAAITDIIYNA